jgi:hypothetical protein
MINATMITYKIKTYKSKHNNPITITNQWAKSTYNILINELIF